MELSQWHLAHRTGLASFFEDLATERTGKERRHEEHSQSGRERWGSPSGGQISHPFGSQRSRSAAFASATRLVLVARTWLVLPNSIHDVDTWLKAHPGWSREGEALVGDVSSCRTSGSCLALAVRLGMVGEKRDHHPDVLDRAEGSRPLDDSRRWGHYPARPGLWPRRLISWLGEPDLPFRGGSGTSPHRGLAFESCRLQVDRR